MKGGVFGNQLRKLIDGHIDSSTVKELYNLFMDANNEKTGTCEETIKQFVDRVGDTYSLKLKSKNYSAQNGFNRLKESPKIKKFTPKRAAIERQYEKVKAEIMEERKHICAGCHRGDCRLTFSHRVPRSKRVDLVAIKENIDIMCDATGANCHEKVEQLQWDELKNGQEIAAYVKRVEPEIYLNYFYKHKSA